MQPLAFLFRSIPVKSGAANVLATMGLVWLLGAFLTPALSAQSATALESSPRKITCRSQAEAFQLGNTYAVSLDGKLVLTSGTRSMEPLIRGKAYVVVRKLPYETITKGALLVYMGRPNASRSDRISMLHRTVAHDTGGWLMRGDNNARTESWDRVTPNNYLGTVEMILEYPQT